MAYPMEYVDIVSILLIKTEWLALFQREKEES